MSNRRSLGPENFPRPAKALTDSGLAENFADVDALLAEARPQIVVGHDATSHGHHAAILGALGAAHRSFGATIAVVVPQVLAATRCCINGLDRMTLGQAIEAAGGAVAERAEPERIAIVVGDGRALIEHSLQVTWNQWTAHVSTHGERLPEKGNMPLAPVAAAAIAVGECFKVLLGDLEATYRDRTLNFWQPEVPLDPERTSDPRYVGPDLAYLPADAWIIGLGHLGQGLAWCWRLLPYADRSLVRLALQDFDKVSEANTSTGMLVDGDAVGMKKTRLVAAALEDAGFETTIIERAFTADLCWASGDPALAFLGIDRREPRRLISRVGWSLAIDTGLGAGPVDFTAISLHTFPPAGDSNDLAAFKTHAPTNRGDRAMEQQAYRHASAEVGSVNKGAAACGLVQLAETAVAAPFVGLVAACLAIAEPLRLLHGGGVSASASFNVGERQPSRRAAVDADIRLPFVLAANHSAIGDRWDARMMDPSVG